MTFYSFTHRDTAKYLLSLFIQPVGLGFLQITNQKYLNTDLGLASMDFGPIGNKLVPDWSVPGLASWFAGAGLHLTEGTNRNQAFT
jgi:hypothetical protein